MELYKTGDEVTEGGDSAGSVLHLTPSYGRRNGRGQIFLAYFVQLSVPRRAGMLPELNTNQAAQATPALCDADMRYKLNLSLTMGRPVIPERQCGGGYAISKERELTVKVWYTYYPVLIPRCNVA